MVLAKLPVLWSPTNLDNSRARAYPLAIDAGGGCLDILLSSIISPFFLSLSGKRPNNTEILSQRAVKPKTTNQPTNQ